MKRPFTICLVLICIFPFWGCDTDSNIKDPSESYFIKYYGTDGNQAGVDMLALDDGTFLLLGNTQINGAKSIYLVKVNAKGGVIWETTFEGTNETAVDIEPTLGNNFVVVAEVENSADDSDVKLILVSPNGTELQSQIYGTPGAKKDTPKSVTPLRDGGYIVTGVTIADTATATEEVNPDLYSNIFHFRCDASLVFDNSNWYELYGATDKVDGGVKTFQDASDNFYVFGYSNQEIRAGQNGNIAQLYYRIGDGGTADSEVGVLGANSQNVRAESVYKVGPTLGGGFLIVGTVVSPSGPSTLHASRIREDLKFDSRDEVFVREIVVPQASVEGVAGTVSLTSPQGFLLLGEELRTLATRNLSLSKIDQSGQLIWTVSLGSEEENDEAASVIETTDGRILVLGTVELGDNQTKMALFKLNSTGRLHD